MASVDTPASDGVSTSGVIGDMFDAIRRGRVDLEKRARDAIDRMRDAYEQARMRRMLNLALVVGLAYLLLRKR